MSSFTIRIDGREVEVASEQTVLAAARQVGLDIPTLCYLEKCGPLTTCLVCLVKINGRLVPSCGTKVAPDMVVESETEEVHTARRTALELLFSDHVGDCLSPCNLLCPLQLNIPVMIRQIESGNAAAAATTVRDTLPLPGVLGRLCHHPCEKGCRRGAADAPAAIRDMERFAADHAASIPPEHAFPRGAPTGRRVAVVGAGPTGLAAAFFLVQQGHAVDLFDRHAMPGGSLRHEAETALPPMVLATEVARLISLGVQVHPMAELGRTHDLTALQSGRDAVVLAIGETSADERGALGAPLATNGFKVDPHTCATEMPAVFAAGALVKPVKQLVRAMAEGKAVAECVGQFLRGATMRRRDKPFSSLMGRLEPTELRAFAERGSQRERGPGCSGCGLGLGAEAAAGEASRCLDCDCRSAGNCALQLYAQAYQADAGRFRSKRKAFEEQRQPGGVIFEPGKCILCGICVKLTELAREPLGLTFIGRGFDVQIGAPLNRSIEDGLQTVAEEVVHHCPTGALSFERDRVGR